MSLQLLPVDGKVGGSSRLREVANNVEMLQVCIEHLAISQTNYNVVFRNNCKLWREDKENTFLHKKSRGYEFPTLGIQSAVCVWSCHGDTSYLSYWLWSKALQRLDQFCIIDLTVD